MHKRISWKELKELVKTKKILLDNEHDGIEILSNRGHGLADISFVGVLTFKPLDRFDAKTVIECDPRQEVEILYDTGPSGGRGKAIVMVKSLTFEVDYYLQVRPEWIRDSHDCPKRVNIIQVSYFSADRGNIISVKELKELLRTCPDESDILLAA